MNFTESIQTCYKKFFDFSGRASKSEYWWFQSYTIIVYGLLFVFQGDLVLLFSIFSPSAVTSQLGHVADVVIMSPSTLNKEFEVFHVRVPFGCSVLKDI